MILLPGRLQPVAGPETTGESKSQSVPGKRTLGFKEMPGTLWRRSEA